MSLESDNNDESQASFPPPKESWWKTATKPLRWLWNKATSKKSGSKPEVEEDHSDASSTTTTASNVSDSSMESPRSVDDYAPTQAASEQNDGPVTGGNPTVPSQAHKEPNHSLQGEEDTQNQLESPISNSQPDTSKARYNSKATSDKTPWYKSPALGVAVAVLVIATAPYSFMAIAAVGALAAAGAIVYGIGKGIQALWNKATKKKPEEEQPLPEPTEPERQRTQVKSQEVPSQTQQPSPDTRAAAQAAAAQAGLSRSSSNASQTPPPPRSRTHSNASSIAH